MEASCSVYPRWSPFLTSNFDVLWHLLFAGMTWLLPVVNNGHVRANQLRVSIHLLTCTHNSLCFHDVYVLFTSILCYMKDEKSVKIFFIYFSYIFHLLFSWDCCCFLMDTISYNWRIHEILHLCLITIVLTVLCQIVFILVTAVTRSCLFSQDPGL